MAEADPFKSGLLEEADASSKERAKRDSLFLLTTIAHEGGAPLGSARVRNLSATGCMADCDHMFVDGDRIDLDLRGVGHVVGRVAWARGSRIGIQFDREIDPSLARKPIQARPAENLPPYLRHLNRAGRFSR